MNFIGFASNKIFSFDEQKSALEAYCTNENYTLVSVTTDLEAAFQSKESAAILCLQLESLPQTILELASLRTKYNKELICLRGPQLTERSLQIAPGL